MPNAINKIQWAKEILQEKPEFEIIMKQDGKVVYHNKTFAGVLNFVQSVDEVNSKEMSITGDSQAFGFGNPYLQLFAIDQLRKKLIPGIALIIKEIKGVKKNGK